MSDLQVLFQGDGCWINILAFTLSIKMCFCQSEKTNPVAQTEVFRLQQLTAPFIPTVESQIGCVINVRTHTTKSILIRIWVRRIVSGI